MIIDLSVIQVATGRNAGKGLQGKVIPNGTVTDLDHEPSSISQSASRRVRSLGGRSLC